MVSRNEKGEIVNSSLVRRSKDKPTKRVEKELPPAPRVEKYPSKRFEQTVEPDAAKTRLIRSKSKNNSIRPSQNEIDPVVGWLVQKNGDCQGQSHTLGYGNNSIGRTEESDICLTNTDDTISRKRHCTVSYDPRGRKFYLQPGEGRNLTYLNGDPVLGAMPISDRDEILIGNTVLIFIAFCGSDFDWQDEKA